ncbi:ATP-dependent DNA helicase [Enterococcus sp. BWB1-3]|uniref:ATP-dependent DNA helicase n=1 Tax=unclassified Enterococcus TaxID=2608891 RepID=UPI001921405A|nr:ATP-dependent DNA helicase [Enterococcus sp. BWT-B8]MBL1229429.1 ATP-dependent DNA helicase [Enterococcus sp. BWB1-3]MCB5952600.1 ATP-dependent DNA helicase [Enterococcus sp. BWT-B8]
MFDSEKIPIRKLVEFILRKGSIDARKTSSHTAQEGARIHRKIQKEAGKNYQKEIKISKEIRLNNTSYFVEGRMDGLFKNEEEEIVIDEIKTSEAAFEDLYEEQLDMYWNQVKCYGAIYSQQEELTEVVLQLTYYQTTTEEITKTQKIYTQTELGKFLDMLLAEYEKWLIFNENWRVIRNESLKNLSFPYGEYRKGQRELAVGVYKTILSEKRLFVEAPTGTGKTISTLFPSLKAMGEKKAEKIFYLTAKTITRQVAEDAVEGMKQKELKIKSITITAKDKICFLSERNCTPEHCPFAAGYYDRLNEGLWDILHSEDQFTRPIIEKYAQKHQLCPYELSLDISLWCDLVICDYNYVFDPVVYLRRFFDEGVKKEYVFLIDEAHNLVNRSREMYSAELSKFQVSVLKKLLGKKQKSLTRTINQVIDELNQLDEYCKSEEKEFISQPAPIDSLNKQLFRLTEKIGEWLPQNQELPELNQVLEIYFSMLNYLKISEFYDDHYCTYIQKKNHTIIIKQFCLDPSYLLDQKLSMAHTGILFSASFTPLSYYKEILGGTDESLTYRIPNPFPEENQLLLIANYIRTTYRERQNSLNTLIQSLTAMIQQKKGNYLFFFPSYAYLDMVYDAFNEKNPDIKLLIQQTEMEEKERERFLEQFTEKPKETLIGFCVLGGVFSEGIDLKGDRLIGTAIISVGLPQINEEQELIKHYFDEQGLGFQYAYQIPGMNKVLQAAGRVIRDAADSGVVLLLDQRFASPDYQRLMPPHWYRAQVQPTLAHLERQIEQFWQPKEKFEKGVKE